MIKNTIRKKKEFEKNISNIDISKIHLKHTRNINQIPVFQNILNKMKMIFNGKNKKKNNIGKIMKTQIQNKIKSDGKITKNPVHIKSNVNTNKKKFTVCSSIKGKNLIKLRVRK